MHDIASYLSSNFVFAHDEKQLEALKNGIGSVSKLLKQVTSCMYMQRYMMGAKVMHNSFHLEVVGLIEQKAMEMGRTAPPGAGAGGSVVSRLLRGFKSVLCVPGTAAGGRRSHRLAVRAVFQYRPGPADTAARAPSCR